MSAVANVVVADAVPANTTLTPLSASLAETNWLQRTANSIAGNRSLRTGLSLSHSKRPSDRVYVLYKKPKEVLVDGVWLVESTGIHESSSVIPETWTTQERLNFATEIASIYAGTPVKLSIQRDPPSHG